MQVSCWIDNIAGLPEGGNLAEDLDPKDYLFRIDHQTFRKLPKSQAIIFGVHPILRPLSAFADSPMVPALLATIHEKSDSELMKYKLAPVYQNKMLPYLKELTKSQIERGLMTWVFHLFFSSELIRIYTDKSHNSGEENESDFADFRELLKKWFRSRWFF